MLRRLLIGPSSAFAVVAVVLAATPASAEDTVAAQPPPSITIEGAASATVDPDTAIVSFGVVTTRATASETIAANSMVLGRALMTLKAQGVTFDAMTTSALDLSAVYDEPKTGTPTVVGYSARNELVIRVPTSHDVGKLLAAVIDDGINSIDGVGFVSNLEAATRDRLKGDAAKDARREADIYAAALGLKLGRVLAIRPETTATLPLRMQAAMAGRAPSPAVPIEAGRLHISERVSVTFELVQ